MAWKPPAGALAAPTTPAAPAPPAAEPMVPHPLNPAAAPVPASVAAQLRAQMPPAAPLPPPTPAASAVPPPAPLPPAPSAVAPGTLAPPPATAAGAPPPAVPAAPPSRRRGRAPAADAAPAAAPVAPAAPAPVAQAAPVAAAPVQAAAVAVTSAVPQLPGMPPGSYLSAMFAAASNPATVAALATFHDAFGGGGGVPNLFPTIALNDRGMFELDAMNVEGTDAEAPQGRDAFGGVFLGYRWSVLCWPRASERNGPKERPVWQAYVGSAADPAVAEVVANAVRAYSYTKKEMKVAFDGLGHPRAALELLWYQADARGDLGLLVTRSSATMHSTLGTMDALLAALPRVTDAAGIPVPSLAPFPAVISPSAPTPVASKGQTWEEYTIAIAQQATGDGAIALQKFQEWLAKGGYTAEVDAALKAWNETTITDEQCNALYAISQHRK